MSSSVDSINWQNTSPSQTQGSATPGTLKGSDYQTTSKDDTVKLSVGAQVHQLSQQGYSSKEIASELGLTTKEVQNYLGVDLTLATQLAAVAGGSSNKGS